MPYGYIYLPESLPFYPTEDRRRRPRFAEETQQPRCPKCRGQLVALQGLRGPVWTCDCCLAAHQQEQQRKRQQRREAA